MKKMKTKKKTPEQIAAATLASIGGKNGTGAAKNRGRDHYVRMAAKSAETRAKNAAKKKGEQ